MDQKEELQNEELKNVSGGMVTPDDGDAYCPKCLKTFTSNVDNQRIKKDGCNAHTEYQCPTCKTWVRID